MERKTLFVLAGVMLGLWHLWLSLGAVFVFRQDEPLTSWLAIASFGLTCPASLVALWKGRVGAMILGISLTLSLPAITGGFSAEEVLAWALVIGGPQAFLGTMFWRADRHVSNAES
jgi:hypothetical protein